MKTTLEEHLVFKTVVETGSITAAADQLGQTVSGVSRALSRLEQKLDTTLLRRTTRRLELTDEGRHFLAQIRAILASVDEAEEQLAIRRQRPAGRLRVNAAPSFMVHTIVPLVGAFREQYPGITLELDTNDRFIDLLEQRTDVAIRIGELRDSTLQARPLGQSPLRLLASPEYLATYGEPKSVADLKRHTLLGFSQLDHLNEWPVLDKHGRRLHVTPDLSASSGMTLLALVQAGQGIACLADFMTHTAREQGQLVPVLVDHLQDVQQTINAVYYRNTQLSLRITLFLDFIAQHLNTRL
ncbi:transcriptional regulator, LysR family [Pseudomonas duriflava]|uniref:Transcriptional regulator, LysR family n=1 Tax=Pseudomonas duriflava TaxID=459528 RepID=A0A562QE40_9PSED|nr:LysR family transcriptional regulator [Pseudomonas duriflava]TWI54963.1 transcriptional regulator, LysR family [Pseudomonas duriflava]